MHLHDVLLAAGMIALPAAAQQGLLERFAHRLTQPKAYYCLPTQGQITIDGRLDEADWQRAPHTDTFVDIEGERKPLPRHRTTAQLLWDADYLYVAATLEEPHIVGWLQQRDTIIWKENDFEVFLDPDGDGIDYFEFEVNARNTLMDLLVTHRYAAGGEFVMPWDCTGLRHAVHLDGTLNDSTDTDRGWTVEMAIPIRSLRKNFGYTQGAKMGELWRLNFSRVQWMRKGAPEDNWVWSPIGIVAMHEPERWGFLHFVEKAPAMPLAHPHTAEYRLLWALYYAQEAFLAEHKVYASSTVLLPRLGLTASDYATLPEGARLEMDASAVAFTFRIVLPDGTRHEVNERGRYRCMK